MRKITPSVALMVLALPAAAGAQVMAPPPSGTVSIAVTGMTVYKAHSGPMGGRLSSGYIQLRYHVTTTAAPGSPATATCTFHSRVWDIESAGSEPFYEETKTIDFARPYDADRVLYIQCGDLPQDLMELGVDVYLGDGAPDDGTPPIATWNTEWQNT